MNIKDLNKIKETVIDEWIWIIFIILSFLNIIGDEKVKDYCYTHDNTYQLSSKKIFKLTVLVSFFIYVYISGNNINKYFKQKKENKDTSTITMRCFSSILVVVASIISLMVQFNDKNAINPDLE